MPANDQTSNLNHNRKMLDILSSVAIGDASAEDVRALLKAEKTESPDLVARMMTRGLPGGIEEIAAEPAPGNRGRKPSSKMEQGHVVPEVPFLLNGTLYDPKDVRRFDDQALHFVPSANSEFMLAIDDADVMVNWWWLLRLTSLQHFHDNQFRSEKAIPGPRPSDTSRLDSGDLVLFDHGTGGGVGPVPCYYIFSYIYEHNDFSG